MTARHSPLFTLGSGQSGLGIYTSGRHTALVLEKPEQIKQRLKERFSQVPAERKLVDELIVERREECRREGEG